MWADQFFFLHADVSILVNRDMNTLSINIAWGWKFACSLDWIAELLLVAGTVIMEVFTNGVCH